jgi:hypothetical protein
VARAGLDINNPTKEGILKAVEYLAEAENEFKDEKTVLDNREKRIDWARNVRD